MEMGGVTCGLVRDLVISFLRLRDMSKLRSLQWYASLAGAVNRPVLGFLVESLCISNLASSSSNAKQVLLSDEKGSYNVVPFEGNTPRLDYAGNNLYVPLMYNFPFVDAMFVEDLGPTGSGPRRRFTGIQITLQSSKGHSEAERPFCRKALWWAEQSGWDLKTIDYRFLWILEAKSSTDDLPEEVVPGDNNDFAPCPAYERKIITFGDISENLAAKLKIARKSLPKVVESSASWQKNMEAERKNKEKEAKEAAKLSKKREGKGKKRGAGELSTDRQKTPTKKPKKIKKMPPAEEPEED